MNLKEFKKLVDNRIKLINTTLILKQKEYAPESDVLHNFKCAGKMDDCTPERALQGMKTKHDVSIRDIIHKIEYNGEYPDVKLLEEKIGDSINYLILLEALIKENIVKNEVS